MKKCKSCKKEIDLKASKCPFCQTDQRIWLVRHPILSALIGLFIFIFVITFSGAKPDKENAPSITSTNNASPQSSSVKADIQPTPDAHVHFSDGTFEVGKDIQPGTYRTRQASSGCYYSRLAGFSGNLSDILANENTDYPAIVTILSTDKGFKSERCGTWTQDVSSINSDKTIFGDGDYFIGTDIEPGTYKNTGSKSCYYSRVSGFSGALSDIISNENTENTAIVTISSTDKGFKSSRCGTWTKQ